MCSLYEADGLFFLIVLVLWPMFSAASSSAEGDTHAVSKGLGMPGGGYESFGYDAYFHIRRVNALVNDDWFMSTMTAHQSLIPMVIPY